VPESGQQVNLIKQLVARLWMKAVKPITLSDLQLLLDLVDANPILKLAYLTIAERDIDLAIKLIRQDKHITRTDIERVKLILEKSIKLNAKIFDKKGKVVGKVGLVDPIVDENFGLFVTWLFRVEICACGGGTCASQPTYQCFETIYNIDGTYVCANTISQIYNGDLIFLSGTSPPSSRFRTVGISRRYVYNKTIRLSGTFATGATPESYGAIGICLYTGRHYNVTCCSSCPEGAKDECDCCPLLYVEYSVTLDPETQYVVWVELYF